MLKVAMIAEGFPLYDRSSAGLRSYTTAKILAEKYQVTYLVLRDALQEEILNSAESEKYSAALKAVGIQVRTEMPEGILKAEKFDAVIIKYYYTAEKYLELVRLLQPEAVVMVDSVDVHYYRLHLKAIITNADEELKKAAAVKSRELAIYKKADVVIAVTEEDKRVLIQEDPTLVVGILPNIHPIPELPVGMERDNSLIFVGIFSHEPNVDAVLFFYREIWPLIMNEMPDVKWKIVGGQPPPTITALASRQIDVTGYVPDTLPFLLSSAVSIAPLRFGAGMKGKVGEAMAAGLPVATTSIGAQGMGLTHGEDVLIADTPVDFARAVVDLLKDEILYRKISSNGRVFIKNKYSPEAVAEKVYHIFDHLDKFPIKRWSLLSRATRKAARVVKHQFEQHIAWRLRPQR